jgi:histidine ammonia-lyase
MLNMFTSKLPFEPSSLPNYPCLRSLYWTCSSKFLQNKTLCYPVSADSLVGDSYTSDISYSLRNMDHKHRVIFKNLLEIVGLELVLGVEVMEGLKGVYKEGLTEQLSKEVELAREFFKTGGQLEREFEGNL